MQSNETINGTIEKFIYQSIDNSFVIFTLKAKNPQSSITVKGNLANIQIGQEVQLKGAWIFHPKFGKQFEAVECISQLPTTVVGLKKYLGSGLIKGIGPTYAEKLVNYFGIKTLDIIDKNPSRLIEVSGIGAKRIEKISQAWHEQKEIANLMVFLQDKGISTSVATKIYKKYRHESVAVLNENPYRLADEIWGIGFKSADELALKLGFELHSIKRIIAGIKFVIASVSQQGHLYIELNELKEKSLNLLQLNLAEHSDLIKQALHSLYSNEEIKLISKEDKHYITLSSYYYTENNVAQKINKIISIPSIFNFDVDVIYKKLRINNPNEIELNEDQQKGIISCIQNKITIITGGPGTGKTTLIKKLLQVLDAEKASYKLAAPTGRAAKRIIEGTGKFATTIHRLLEFDMSKMGFQHNENNALKLNFLIIDEASMIDIFLANAILKSLPLNAHLVLIGDVDQLPSVGPGNFLNDLIKSQKISCIKLTKIFRQAQDSLIVVNAHKINNGEFPINFQENGKKDFVFIKEENPEMVMNHVKKILFIKLKSLGIPINDSILLTPMNRGIVGTQSLNHFLQETLNSEKTNFINFAGNKFKLNDKVMQIRNNYDKNVYNGDIGIISDINFEDKELVVNFDGRLVNYEFDELNELVLAYSISIHKSQGSEYSAVIVPIFMQHFMLLQKNLIYTALTRAKKLCIFIGQSKALAIAIKNNKGTKRNTFLETFLKENTTEIDKY